MQYVYRCCRFYMPKSFKLYTLFFFFPLSFKKSLKVTYCEVWNSLLSPSYHNPDDISMTKSNPKSFFNLPMTVACPSELVLFVNSMHVRLSPEASLPLAGHQVFGPPQPAAESPALSDTAVGFCSAPPAHDSFFYLWSCCTSSGGLEVRSGGGRGHSSVWRAL